jgi:hypothetical protein
MAQNQAEWGVLVGLRAVSFSPFWFVPGKYLASRSSVLAVGDGEF